MKTLTEKQIENKFKNHKKQYIKKLGINATTNHQLEEIGNKDIKNFIGVYSQDSKIPSNPKKCSFIINTDYKNGPGEHWIAIHRTNNNTYYIFDSFGRRSKKLLPHFIKGKLHIDSDYDKNQSEDSAICGPLCLAWLKCVDNYGIINSLKI